MLLEQWSCAALAQQDGSTVVLLLSLAARKLVWGG